jgi:hypothetical protein
MAEKVWLRVPEHHELPAGTSSYWGVDCHVCGKRLAIGDASSKSTAEVRQISANALPGKMLWVICPNCRDQDQLYHHDELIVFPAA